MRVFSDLDMCEQLGFGMRKILSKYPQSIFEIFENFISVKLPYTEEVLKYQSVLDMLNSVTNSTVNYQRLNKKH